MNSPVAFNDVIVDLPHQSQIHHLWLINISSDESLIMGLLWNTSSNLMSLMRPPLKNHLAKAWKALEHSCLNLNSTPKTCQSEAAKHLLYWDSNVFPHADTIATFQFQLHLKPPISAAVLVIEIWNPAYIQAITENTRPQLLCACPGKWGEKKQQGSSTAGTHFYLFIIQ